MLGVKYDHHVKVALKIQAEELYEGNLQQL